MDRLCPENYALAEHPQGHFLNKSSFPSAAIDVPTQNYYLGNAPTMSYLRTSFKELGGLTVNGTSGLINARNDFH